MQPVTMFTRRFGDGELIFEAGDRAQSMYMVIRGKARVFRQVHGVEVVLDTVGRGEILGDVSFLTSRPHSASARALGETELWLIGGEDVDDVAADPLTHKLFVTLATRLRSMDDQYARLVLEAERRRRCLEAIEHRNACA